MSNLDKEYEASLKSIETENVVDRAFYRPIGFRIARMIARHGDYPEYGNGYFYICGSCCRLHVLS